MGEKFCHPPGGYYPNIRKLWVRTFLLSFLLMNINHLATAAPGILLFHFSFQSSLSQLSSPNWKSTMDKSHVCARRTTYKKLAALKSNVSNVRGGGWLFRKHLLWSHEKNMRLSKNHRLIGRCYDWICIIYHYCDASSPLSQLILLAARGRERKIDWKRVSLVIRHWIRNLETRGFDSIVSFFLMPPPSFRIKMYSAARQWRDRVTLGWSVTTCNRYVEYTGCVASGGHETGLGWLWSGYSIILPSWAAAQPNLPNSHLPKQNWAGSGMINIKANPTQGSDHQTHSLCIVPHRSPISPMTALTTKGTVYRDLVWFLSQLWKQKL